MSYLWTTTTRGANMNLPQILRRAINMLRPEYISLQLVTARKSKIVVLPPTVSEFKLRLLELNIIWNKFSIVYVCLHHAEYVRGFAILYTCNDILIHRCSRWKLLSNMLRTSLIGVVVPLSTMTLQSLYPTLKHQPLGIPVEDLL